MASIDRDSPIPIYHQLKTLIREQIESGVWRPGERIPTELELCRSYNISRSPVRQALGELSYEGLLVRRPALGTFVRDRTVAGPAQDTVIQVMSSDPRWSTVLDQVSHVWNAKYSQKITFHVQVVDHSQFYNLLSSDVGRGTAPDVALVDTVWVAGLAQSGFLYALEDLITRQNYDEFVGDLYPAFVEASSFEGKLYGWPAKADASLLWYRKDWFTQEGLEPPQDWDDLLDVSRHFLQSQVRERYALDHPLAFPSGVAGGEATVYNLMSFVWSAGGKIFDAETVVLDSPDTQRAIQFLRELVTGHRASPLKVVNYKATTSLKLFASGKVAMALGGSYESDLIRNASSWKGDELLQRAGYVAPPAAPGKYSVSTVGGSSYVILRQCQSPALMMDILKVATDANVVGDMYRSMLQDSPSLSFGNLLRAETDPLLAKTSRMVASGRARPSIPEYFKVSRQLQAMFEAVISDSVPVTEIARRTAEFVGVITGRDLDGP
ncbi:MAG: extracellular solute-binding protein [Chloroflexi bacterium]|nr:extracellular solute-binding protein [Chloroflexota bacterium]